MLCLPGVWRLSKLVTFLYTHCQLAECLGVHFNGFCFCTPCNAITFHSVRVHDHGTYAVCVCVCCRDVRDYHTVFVVCDIVMG